MKKEFLRQSTCNQCLHGRPRGIDYQKSFCEKTGREGSVERACCCEKFERRLNSSSSILSPQGFKYRSKQIEDYRTRRQWEDAGYKVRDGEVGYEMHASMMSGKTFLYYLPEQVERMNDTEEICATCGIRQGRFCEVAGDYVSSSHRCSEWISKELAIL